MGTYENNRKNARFVGLTLRKTTDADILQALEREPNMQGFIKACIREHIAAKSFKEADTMKKFAMKMTFTGVEDGNCVCTEGASGGSGPITATVIFPDAEIAIPDDIRDDEAAVDRFIDSLPAKLEYYGYATMKYAIIEALNNAGYSADGIEWFYADESDLPANAFAECPVELDIDFDALDELCEAQAR